MIWVYPALSQSFVDIFYSPDVDHVAQYTKQRNILQFYLALRVNLCYYLTFVDQAQHDDVQGLSLASIEQIWLLFYLLFDFNTGLKESPAEFPDQHVD